MAQIVYWGLFPGFKTFLRERPKQCVNFIAGVGCGVAQAVGVEIFTKDSVNQALSLKTASDECKISLRS